MEILLVLAASAGIAALAAYAVTSYVAPKRANEVYSDLRAAFEDERLRGAALRDDASMLLERASKHRTAQRASEQRMEGKEAAAPAMDRDTYLLHLERGGKPIPEVEATLGLDS